MMSILFGGRVDLLLILFEWLEKLAYPPAVPLSYMQYGRHNTRCTEIFYSLLMIFAIFIV